MVETASMCGGVAHDREIAPIFNMVRECGALEEQRQDFRFWSLMVAMDCLVE